MPTYPQPLEPGAAPATRDPLVGVFGHNRSGLSVCGNYWVLPASLVTEPLLRARLAEFVTDVRAAHPHVDWPQYQVAATTLCPVGELSLNKLDDAGIFAELDDQGNPHYYQRRQPGRELDPATPVLVTRPDPTLHRASGHRRP